MIHPSDDPVVLPVNSSPIHECLEFVLAIEEFIEDQEGPFGQESA